MIRNSHSIRLLAVAVVLITSPSFIHARAFQKGGSDSKVEVVKSRVGTALKWSEPLSKLVTRHFVVVVDSKGSVTALEELTSKESKVEQAFATIAVRVSPNGSSLEGFNVNHTERLGMGKCRVPNGLRELFESHGVNPKTLQHLNDLFNNGGPFMAGRQLWNGMEHGHRLDKSVLGAGNKRTPRATGNPSSRIPKDPRGRNDGTGQLHPWLDKGPSGDPPTNYFTGGDRSSGYAFGGEYLNSGESRSVLWGGTAREMLGQLTGGGDGGSKSDTQPPGGELWLRHTTVVDKDKNTVRITEYRLVDDKGNVWGSGTVFRVAPRVGPGPAEESTKPAEKYPKGEPKSNPDEGNSKADIFAEIARMGQWRRNAGLGLAWMVFRPEKSLGKGASVLPPREMPGRPVGDIRKPGKEAGINPDEGRVSSTGGTKMPLWPRGCPFDNLFQPTNPR